MDYKTEKVSVPFHSKKKSRPPIPALETVSGTPLQKIKANTDPSICFFAFDSNSKQMK